MKRLARPALALGLAVGIAMSLGRAAVATPFSDVPANQWAYQYIQALAADGVIEGYTDGKFNGNRPMTRYEAATLVARAINKIRETTASKEDLDKLAKLVAAFRDELDALGVRVSNLEDRLDYLDAKTKFAQSISMVGDLRPQLTFRQRVQPPYNSVGAAPVGADALVANYISSDDSNLVWTGNGSGIQIRQDSKFAFIYRVSDNLTVTFPIRLLNFEYGGAYTQQSSIQVLPAVRIGVDQAGALKNFAVTVGTIDNLTSSRTGLAFRAPSGDFTFTYEYPLQPLQKGALISGSLGGLTDFNASFTRVDQVALNTLGYDPSVPQNNATYSYLFPVVPPQFGLNQNTPAGAPKQDTYNSGAGALSQVYLSSPAQTGTVYISSVNGQPYNSNGSCATAPCNGPATAPAFIYNAGINAVVFNPPVPAGTVITVAYVSLAATSNNVPQRYMANARINQKLPHILAGSEIGVTYTRIFDFFDPGYTNNNYTPGAQQAPVTGTGALSDTVIGADFQVKLPFKVSGAGSEPVLFGELAQSKFTPDQNNLSATSDTAGVFGARIAYQKALFTLQYQTIGTNFVVGDNLQFYGNPPVVLAGWRAPYLPDFFGFANNLAINQQFDNQFAGFGAAYTPKVATNPAATLLYPIYNPFRGLGPMQFSSFTPNQRGITLNANAPIIVGGGGAAGTTFTTRAQYQHLQEITPNSIPAELYGPAYATHTAMSLDSYTLGTAVDLPAFGQKISLTASGTYELLKRNDTTGFQYYPFNYQGEVCTASGTGVCGAAGIGPTGSVQPPTTLVNYNLANTLIPACVTPGACTYARGSQVTFYPNYVNMKHYIFALGATVPILPDVTLNATYNVQPFGGSYGTTLGQNISETKTYTQGNITYRIPKTNSSVQFQARNFRYTDQTFPSYNFSQNRQDLSFSVRF